MYHPIFFYEDLSVDKAENNFLDSTSLNVFVIANYDVGKLFLNLSLSWEILPELKNTHDGIEGILGPLSNLLRLAPKKGNVQFTIDENDYCLHTL